MTMWNGWMDAREQSRDQREIAENTCLTAKTIKGIMAYGKYKLGTVVFDPISKMFGHIKGFDRTQYEAGYEVILSVKWDDGQTRSIHPSNVELLGVSK